LSSISPVERITERRLPEWKWLLLPAALFIFSVALTHPPFIGDTPFYAGEIAAAHGLNAPTLWEFGHVLWRPAGFILSPLFMAVPDSIAWTPELKIAFGLIGLSLVSGLIGALLIYDLCRRLMAHPVWAMAPVLIFVWGASFLSYSQSGTSYVPALTAMIGAVWLQVVAQTVDRKMLWASGCLMGISCLIWFPFVFVLPAAACSRRFVLLPGRERSVWTDILTMLVIAGIVLTAGVGLAAFLAGVRSIAEFRTWMKAAAHDWHQNRQWIRAISGCPRLLIDLGPDGIYLKRFAFKDPYNPVSAASIVRLTLWKIGLFYALIASTAALAWTSVKARPVLALAGLAGLPLLLFAVLLFEPSSPERFLPALPFLLLAIAAGWTAASGAANWLRAVICLFVLALPIMNWPTFAGSFSEESQRSSARLEDLLKFAGADDVLITINLQDPLIQLIDQDLFNAANRPAPRNNHWMVDVASAKTSLWRQQFAALVLENWRKNRDVWVTKGALEHRPDEDACWVEGDDPAVRWSDVECFSKTLEFDRSTNRSDGFVRLRRSPAQENRLIRLSVEDEQTGNCQAGNQSAGRVSESRSVN
jgi:hypothetical protein